MNNKELALLRQGFFLTQKEAGLYIAGFAEKSAARSWQRLEDGSRSIPAAVVDKLAKIADFRMQQIEAIEDKIAIDERYTLPFYTRFDEFCLDFKDATVLDWRINQSLAFYFFAEGLAGVES